jgi:hypothetical protein
MLVYGGGVDDKEDADDAQRAGQPGAGMRDRNQLRTHLRTKAKTLEQLLITVEAVTVVLSRL